MVKDLRVVPIMSKDDERFMAFTGLIEWTQCVIAQSKRIFEAEQLLNNAQVGGIPPIYALHSEHHFFVIAANKLLEFRDWTRALDLYNGVDFSEIDLFCVQDIQDLRNMREHVVQYFQGRGHFPDRWVFEHPEYSADASACVGTTIGGRLDYVKFAAAAVGLLPELLRQPVPYPVTPV